MKGTFVGETRPTVWTRGISIGKPRGTHTEEAGRETYSEGCEDAGGLARGSRRLGNDSELLALDQRPVVLRMRHCGRHMELYGIGQRFLGSLGSPSMSMSRPRFFFRRTALFRAGACLSYRHWSFTGLQPVGSSQVPMYLTLHLGTCIPAFVVGTCLGVYPLGGTTPQQLPIMINYTIDQLLSQLLHL